MEIYKKLYAIVIIICFVLCACSAGTNQSTVREDAVAVLYLDGQEKAVKTDEKWIYDKIRFILSKEPGEEIVLSVQNDSDYTMSCPSYLRLYQLKDNEWMEMYQEFFGTEDVQIMIKPGTVKEAAKTVVLKLAGARSLDPGQYRVDLEHVELKKDSGESLFKDTVSFYFNMTE